jgi:hypothetical protein
MPLDAQSGRRIKARIPAIAISVTVLLVRNQQYADAGH